MHCIRLNRSPVSRALPAEPLTITLLSCRATPLTASATDEFGTSRIMSTPSRSPLAGDIGADVGLVLMIGESDLDLQLRVRVGFHVILCRHLGGDGAHSNHAIACVSGRATWRCWQLSVALVPIVRCFITCAAQPNPRQSASAFL